MSAGEAKDVGECPHLHVNVMGLCLDCGRHAWDDLYRREIAAKDAEISALRSALERAEGELTRLRGEAVHFHVTGCEHAKTPLFVANCCENNDVALAATQLFESDKNTREVSSLPPHRSGASARGGGAAVARLHAATRTDGVSGRVRRR